MVSSSIYLNAGVFGEALLGLEGGGDGVGAVAQNEVAVLGRDAHQLAVLRPKDAARLDVDAPDQRQVVPLVKGQTANMEHGTWDMEHRTTSKL